jgi:hypothetical protein
MAYFHIMAGLRGCYMPDSAYVLKADTRRELRAALQSEADSQSCDGAFIGLNRKAVSWAAAKAWRERKAIGCQLAILPFGRRGEAAAFSVEIAAASRADYLAQGE